MIQKKCLKELWINVGGMLWKKLKKYLKTNEHELYLLALSLNKEYYLGNDNNEMINDLSTALGR